MLLDLCLGAMCNVWMKHAMTSSWVIAPAPVACMTWLSGKVNPSVQVGIVHVQRILYHWRKVIPQRTNCADFVIQRNFNYQSFTLYHKISTVGKFNRLHARPHSCSHWISTAQPTEQQTDPHESQNLSLWPRNSITVKPLQVAKKAETHTHADGIVKPFHLWKKSHWASNLVSKPCTRDGVAEPTTSETLLHYVKHDKPARRA